MNVLILKILLPSLLLFYCNIIIYAQEGANESKEKLKIKEIKEKLEDEYKSIEKLDNPLTLTLTTDFVSKDIWRGTIATDRFCVQPLLSVSYKGFTFGTVGSHAFTDPELDINEFWISYNLDLNSTSFLIMLYDYHSSGPGNKFFNFKSNGEGSHIPEIQFQISGNESIPLRLMGTLNIYNDPEKSYYIETGFNYKFGDYTLDLVAGITKGPSAIYFVEDDKIAFINLGISLSKEIKISNDFSLPVSVNYFFNDYLEKSFLVFKFSL